MSTGEIYTEGYFIAVERKGNDELIFCTTENARGLANELLRAQAPELPKTCCYANKYELNAEGLRSDLDELSEHKLAEQEFETRADAEGYFNELAGLSDSVLTTIKQIEESDLLQLTGRPRGQTVPQNYKTLKDLVVSYGDWRSSQDQAVTRVNFYTLTEVEKLRSDYAGDKSMGALIKKMVPYDAESAPGAPRVTSWHETEKDLKAQAAARDNGRK